MTWFTGPFEREGAEVFVHLIRSPDDPERMSREARKKLHGPDSPRNEVSTAWKKMDDISIDGWKEKILAGLKDGKGRTWNRLILEISDFHYTADVAFKKNPDKALWELVDDKKIELTGEAPILFRKKGARRW